MTKNILIATPHNEFGELLHLTLEENSDYNIMLVTTGKALMETANKVKFDLVIVDTAINDKPLIPLIQNFQDENPKACLVIVMPQNEANQPDLSDIQVNGFLSRPCYPSDLLKMVEDLIGKSQISDKTAPTKTPNDVKPVMSEADLLKNFASLTIQDSLEEEIPVEEIAIPSPSQVEETTANAPSGIEENHIPEEINLIPDNNIPQFEEIQQTDIPTILETQIEAKPQQEAEPILNAEQLVAEAAASKAETFFDVDAFAKELAALTASAGLQHEDQIPASSSENTTNGEFNTAKEEDIPLIMDISEKPSEEFIPAGEIPAVQSIETPAVEGSQTTPPGEVVTDDQSLVAQLEKILAVGENPTGKEAEALLDQTFPDEIPTAIEPEPSLAETYIINKSSTVIESEPLVVEESQPILKEDTSEIDEGLKPVDNLAILAIEKEISELESEEESTGEVRVETHASPKPVIDFSRSARGDQELAAKHSELAFRYAALADEYRGLADEHSQIAEEHARLATKKTSLTRQKSETSDKISNVINFLNKSLSESGAQAILVVKGSNILGFTGDITEQAFLELASFLERDFEKDGKSDLVRFVHLESSNLEYLVYSTIIKGEIILGMAYDTATPLSKMRISSGQVARNLSQEQKIELLEELSIRQENGALPVDVSKPADKEFPGETIEDLLIQSIPGTIEDFLATIPSPNPPSVIYGSPPEETDDQASIDEILRDVFSQIETKSQADETKNGEDFFEFPNAENEPLLEENVYSNPVDSAYPIAENLQENAQALDQADFADLNISVEEKQSSPKFEFSLESELNKLLEEEEALTKRESIGLVSNDIETEISDETQVTPFSSDFISENLLVQNQPEPEEESPEIILQRVMDQLERQSVEANEESLDEPQLVSLEALEAAETQSYPSQEAYPEEDEILLKVRDQLLNQAVTSDENIQEDEQLPGWYQEMPSNQLEPNSEFSESIKSNLDSLESPLLETNSIMGQVEETAPETNYELLEPFAKSGGKSISEESTLHVKEVPENEELPSDEYLASVFTVSEAAETITEPELDKGEKVIQEPYELDELQEVNVFFPPDVQQEDTSLLTPDITGMEEEEPALKNNVPMSSGGETKEPLATAPQEEPVAEEGLKKEFSLPVAILPGEPGQIEQKANHSEESAFPAAVLPDKHGQDEEPATLDSDSDNLVVQPVLESEPLLNRDFVFPWEEKLVKEPQQPVDIPTQPVKIQNPDLKNSTQTVQRNSPYHSSQAEKPASQGSTQPVRLNKNLNEFNPTGINVDEESNNLINNSLLTEEEQNFSDISKLESEPITSWNIFPPGQTPVANRRSNTLTYTCVLVPRQEEYPINDEIGDELGDSLPDLAGKLGWHLIRLQINPDYLQWTVEVLPTVSPGNLIRIVRQRSSRKIFNNYPKIKEAMSAEDFWAPGYLVVSGIEPPPPNSLEEFIQQTRRRQKLLKSLSS